MKKSITLLLLSLVVLSECYGQIMSEENNPIVHPYSVNHQQIKKINNKDISFYLNNKSIDVNSKLFYQGKFAISDDENTFAICDYVFCRILEISDGAISEVMGVYCMKYMTKFPCEFLGNLKSKELNMPVEKWNVFVAFEQDSKIDFHDFSKQIDQKIKVECPVYNTSWTKIKDEIKEYIEK